MHKISGNGALDALNLHRTPVLNGTGKTTANTFSCKYNFSNLTDSKMFDKKHQIKKQLFIQFFNDDRRTFAR